jgi:hypothetical protein
MPRRPSPARGDQIQQLTARIMLGHQHLPAVIQADVIDGSAGEPAGTAAGRSGYGRPDPPTAGHRCNGRCPHAALHGAVLLDPGRHDPHQPIVRLTSAAHPGSRPAAASGAPARKATASPPAPQLPPAAASSWHPSPPRSAPAGRPWPEPRLPHSQDLAPPPPHSERAQPSAAGGQHADRGAGSLWTACGQPVDTPPATASPPNASPECGAR